MLTSNSSISHHKSNIKDSKEKLPVFAKIRGVHCLFNSSVLARFRGDQNAGKQCKKPPLFRGAVDFISVSD